MSSKAVRQRGRGFAYSVPKFKGSKQRIERTFVLQEEGNRWHADALCAIEAFLPVPEADLYRTTHQQRPQAEHARNPSSTQQERHAPQPMTEKHVGVLIGASNHRFSTVSGEWFHREFVNVPDPKLVAAQNCEQHLRMHLNPYFDALVDDINDITDDHVHGFVLLLAGHVTQQKPSLAGSVTTADFLTAIEAAEFLGCSISKIRVLIKNRKLPNVRYEETPRNRRCILIPVGDLLAVRQSNKRTGDGNSYQRGVGYAPATTESILSTLRRVFKFARSKRLMVGDPSEGLTARTPVRNRAGRKPPTIDPPPLPLEIFIRLLRHLHPHHQLVAILCYFTGMRISEALGVQIGSVHFGDDFALVDIIRQGGQKFQVLDDDGNAIWVDAKEALKLGSLYRYGVLPQVAVDFVQVYIDAFHTIDDVVSAPDERLVCGLKRWGVGGVGAFRSAFKRACVAEQQEFEFLGYYVVPHFLRKSYSTLLLQLRACDDTTRSIILGHRVRSTRGGSPITDLSYTVKLDEVDNIIATGRAINDFLAPQLATLLIPSDAQPKIGTDNHQLRARSSGAASIYGGHGYGTPKEPDESDFLDLSDAAVLLSSTRPTLRRLIDAGDMRSEVGRITNGCIATLVHRADVETMRKQIENALTLPEAAESLDMSANTLWRWMQRGILPGKRSPVQRGTWLIEREAIERVRPEADRLNALDRRSMRITDAAGILGLKPKTTKHLLSVGDLERDPETNGCGETYVTRTSVDRSKELLRAAALRAAPEWHVEGTGWISLQEASERLQITTRAVAGLAEAGLVQRRQYRSRTVILEEDVTFLLGRRAS